MDWSICVDAIRCAEYMAKYTAKCETISEGASKIIKEVLKTNIQDGILQVSPLKLIKRMFMKLHAANDYAGYMVAHHNLSLPLYRTSFKFVPISINQSRNINLRQLRKNQEEKKNQEIKENSNENNYCKSLLFETLLDFYRNRMIIDNMLEPIDENVSNLYFLQIFLYLHLAFWFF